MQDAEVSRSTASCHSSPCEVEFEYTEISRLKPFEECEPVFAGICSLPSDADVPFLREAVSQLEYSYRRKEIELQCALASVESMATEIELFRDRNERLNSENISLKDQIKATKLMIDPNSSMNLGEFRDEQIKNLEKEQKQLKQQLLSRDRRIIDLESHLQSLERTRMSCEIAAKEQLEKNGKSSQQSILLSQSRGRTIVDLERRLSERESSLESGREERKTLQSRHEEVLESMREEQKSDVARLASMREEMEQLRRLADERETSLKTIGQSKNDLEHKCQKQEERLIELQQMKDFYEGGRPLAQSRTEIDRLLSLLSESEQKQKGDLRNYESSLRQSQSIHQKELEKLQKDYQRRQKEMEALMEKRVALHRMEIPAKACDVSPPVSSSFAMPSMTSMMGEASRAPGEGLLRLQEEIIQSLQRERLNVEELLAENQRLWGALGRGARGPGT